MASCVIRKGQGCRSTGEHDQGKGCVFFGGRGTTDPVRVTETIQTMKRNPEAAV
jgi:hypothetical protein